MNSWPVEWRCYCGRVRLDPKQLLIGMRVKCRTCDSLVRRNVSPLGVDVLFSYRALASTHRIYEERTTETSRDRAAGG